MDPDADFVPTPEQPQTVAMDETIDDAVRDTIDALNKDPEGTLEAMILRSNPKKTPERPTPERQPSPPKTRARAKRTADADLPTQPVNKRRVADLAMLLGAAVRPQRKAEKAVADPTNPVEKWDETDIVTTKTPTVDRPFGAGQFDAENVSSKSTQMEIMQRTVDTLTTDLMHVRKETRMRLDKLEKSLAEATAGSRVPGGGATAPAQCGSGPH